MKNSIPGTIAVTAIVISYIVAGEVRARIRRTRRKIRQALYG